MAHLLPSAAFLLSLLHSSASAAAAGDLPHCDLFSGEWVPDPSYPLYQYSSCPIIDPEFNCQLYGRPDSGYLRYRWRPGGCDLPGFNGLNFLERMREKMVMFVGDSLGRNQWESLICLLNAAAPLSPAVIMRGDPLSTYKFLEYEVSVSFYRAPYLVDIDVVNGKRILRLDSIVDNSAAWMDADVLSFNSGHWWTHQGNLQGWDYMGDDGAYYDDMDRVVAFQKGMSTWAKWADLNINSTRTKIFFQSLSPTHYNPMEWKDPISKNCYKEIAPVIGSNYTINNLVEGSMIQVIRDVLNSMRTTTYFLDITRLSELRKDGHPSIYSGDLTPQQRANPDHSSDCSHWCLPGLPDIWNQLFYATLFFFF